MKPPRVVLDTNVLISAIRSKKGASFRLVELLGTGKFQPFVSVPLVLEYEAAMKRQTENSGLTERDVDDIIDYVCSVSRPQKVAYLWRPVLTDPGDDMVLELAVAAGCQYVVTFNAYDFGGARDFGVEIVTPRQFLRVIGETK